MAKRKRLSPAKSDYLAAPAPAPETKSMPLGGAPIAQVAAEAASAAALEELAGAWLEAREAGRMIQEIDEAKIEAGYLVRDRIVADDEELQSLMDSLRARGQQTPVEVVDLGGGQYGLISGWRRLTALRRLLAETGEARFGRVLAILRRPESAADAYVAMVEENEIRVGLSYYERARIAAKAVENSVYDTEKQALLDLFRSASRARRSKIRSFLALYHAADDLLRFPTAIGERLGLSLAKRLEGAPESAERLRAALRQAAAEDADAEQAVLAEILAASAEPAEKAEKVEEQALTPASGPPRAAEETGAGKGGQMWTGREMVAQGIKVQWSGNTLSFSGAAVTETFRKKMLHWIRHGH